MSSKIYIPFRSPQMLAEALDRYVEKMPLGPWGKKPNRSDAIRELLSEGLKDAGFLKQPKRRR